MNFQSMEYFTIIAEERNFTRAAERLHITQQSLSAHIASIEQELGCQLLVRRVPLELTYAGRTFLSYAMDWQESFKSMTKEFNDISQNQKGQLRIGLAHSRSRIIMPLLVKRFLEQYPNIEIDLIVINNREQAEKKEGLDLIISTFDGRSSGFEYEDFYEEEIVLLASLEMLERVGVDPQAVAKEIGGGNLSGLAACPFILLGNETAPSGATALALFTKSKIQPQIKVRAMDQQTILSLCAEGVGACFSPEHMIYAMLSDEQLSRMVMFHLPPQFHYTFQFAYPKHKYQWSVVKDFIKIARSVYPPQKPKSIMSL